MLKLFQIIIQAVSDSQLSFDPRVAEKALLNADPDPAIYFNVNPDPAFHLNPGPLPLQSDGNLLPIVYRPSRAAILSLQASIVSVHVLSRLYFELFKFDFNADPDPAFYFNVYPDPALHFNADPNHLLFKVMRICDATTGV
jgi:hypothetical protein